MKSSQKFDYRRFADHLIERGLVDRETAEHVLEQCEGSGALLPEILVQEGLVSDWEVGRVACELYHLPFLPVECYPPSEKAREGLDPDYLRQFALVPVDRYGDLLTVAVPGIVPHEVLEGLNPDRKLRLLPVIGSVSSNRRWLSENLPSPEMPGVDDISAALPDEGGWESIFDAADEAVQLELSGTEDEGGLDLGLGEALGDVEDAPKAPAPKKKKKKPSGPRKELRLKGEDDG